MKEKIKKNESIIRNIDTQTLKKDLDNDDNDDKLTIKDWIVGIICIVIIACIVIGIPIFLIWAIIHFPLLVVLKFALKAILIIIILALPLSLILSLFAE